MHKNQNLTLPAVNHNTKYRKEKTELLVPLNDNKPPVLGSTLTAAAPVGSAAPEIPAVWTVAHSTKKETIKVFRYEIKKDPRVLEVEEFHKYHFWQFSIKAKHCEELIYFDSLFVKENPNTEVTSLIVRRDEMRNLLKNLQKIELKIADYNHVVQHSLLHVLHLEDVDLYLKFRRKIVYLLLLQKKIIEAMQGKIEVKSYVLKDGSYEIECNIIVSLLNDAKMPETTRNIFLNLLPEAIQDLSLYTKMYINLDMVFKYICALDAHISTINQEMNTNSLKGKEAKNLLLSNKLKSYLEKKQQKIHEKAVMEEELSAYIAKIDLPSSKISQFDVVLNQITAGYKPQKMPVT